MKAQKIQRDRLINGFQNLTGAQKIGREFDSAAMRVALTHFEGREVYVKSNNLFQLDLWDLETQRVLFSFKNEYKNRILSIVATSDAKFLIFSSGKTIVVWSLEKKALHYQVEDAHDTPIPILAVTKDNKYLISVSQSNTIKVWDLQKEEEKEEAVLAIPNAHYESIWSLVIAPDSDHFVSSGKDGITAVWSISKGKNIFRFHEETGHGIAASAVTPDGKFLISASENGCVFIWDLKLGTLSDRLLTETSVLITSLAVSADSKRLYCGCDHGVTLEWNLENKTRGSPKQISQKTHRSAVCQLQFSANNKYLVLTSINGSVILWNYANQSQPTFYRAMEHHILGDSVAAIRLTPDSKYIVVAIKSRICVFSVDERKLVGVFREREGQTIYQMMLTQDGKEALVATSDDAILILDLETLEIVDKIPHEFGKNLGNTIKMRTDGQNLIVTDCSQKHISIISLKEKKLIHQLPEPGVLEVALSLDLKYLAVGTEENMISIWDYQTKKPLQNHPEPNESFPSHLNFTPEGNLMCGSHEGFFTLWNPSNLKAGCLKSFKARLPNYQLFGDEILFVETSADETKPSRLSSLNVKNALEEGKVGDRIPGEFLKGKPKIHGKFEVSFDQKFIYLTTDKGIEVQKLPDKSFHFEIDLTTGHFSSKFRVTPDSKSLVVVTRSNHLELWDIEQRTQNYRFDETHHSPITTLETHKKGASELHPQYILLGTQDGSIQKLCFTEKEGLINQEKTQEKVQEKVHDGPILGIAVTPNSENIVSFDTSQIILWNWEKLEQVHEFTPEKKSTTEPTGASEGKSSFSAIAVSLDSKFIVAGQQDSKLIVYSIVQKKLYIAYRQVDSQNGASISNILITILPLFIG